MSPANQLLSKTDERVVTELVRLSSELRSLDEKLDRVVALVDGGANSPPLNVRLDRLESFVREQADKVKANRDLSRGAFLTALGAILSVAIDLFIHFLKH